MAALPVRSWRRDRPRRASPAHAPQIDRPRALAAGASAASARDASRRPRRGRCGKRRFGASSSDSTARAAASADALSSSRSAAMAALDSFDAAVGAGAAAAPCSPPPPPLCLRMESSAAFFNAAVGGVSLQEEFDAARGEDQLAAIQHGDRAIQRRCTAASPCDWVSWLGAKHDAVLVKGNVPEPPVLKDAVGTSNAWSAHRAKVPSSDTDAPRGTPRLCREARRGSTEIEWLRPCSLWSRWRQRRCWRQTLTRQQRVVMRERV